MVWRLSVQAGDATGAGQMIHPAPSVTATSIPVTHILEDVVSIVVI